MRGIAAFSIVGLHVSGAGILNGAPVFVDFFFVLSGFVLFPSLECDTPKKFLVKRLLRLYPMILTTFTFLILLKLLFTAMFPSVNTFSFGNILGAIILLQVFNLDFLAPNVPLWSLSAEIFVNLIGVILFISIGAKKLIILAIFGGLLLFIGLVIDSQSSNQLSQTMIMLGRAVFGFFLGLHLRKVELNESKREFQKINIIVAYSLFAVLFVTLQFSHFIFILASPVSYFLVKYLSRLQKINNLKKVSNLILSKTCRYLGRISYGIYVWHIPITFLEIEKKLMPNQNYESIFFRLLFIVIELTATIIMTEFTIRFVENPFQNYIKSKNFQIFK